MSNPRRSLTTSSSKSEASAILSATQRLLKFDASLKGKSSSPLILREQPFDFLCFKKSRIYRKSRELFLSEGGSFTSSFTSSPRALSSTVLLTPHIVYSPIWSELLWRVTDRVAIQDPSFLLSLRTFAVSVFHEQSHRLLWRRLGCAPKSKSAVRRFLNLSEALVVTLDMALSDELGPELSRDLHLTGVLYDPGTTLRKDAGSTSRGKRVYRNCLQIGCHATYLLLEGYRSEDIRELCLTLYRHPTYHPKSLVKRMLERSLALDSEFIQRTNPVWQARYAKTAAEALSAPRAKDLSLLYMSLPPVLDPGTDPANQTIRYAITEAWLSEFLP